MENSKYMENDDGTYGDKDHRVLLYRHATSIANIKFNKKGLTSADIKELDWSEVGRDSEIADTGIELAISKQRIFNNLNIHTVFVSPLRRALQTAYHTFKSHPHFDKIKFIIMPKARECINFASGIPTNIDTVVSQFKEFFSNLDDSELDKYKDRLHYFIEDTDHHTYEEILEEKQYKELDPIKSNVFDLIIEKTQKVKPKDLESKESILKRVNYVRNYISDYILTLESDEKVVLLTHYFFLEFWTGEWHDSMFDDHGIDIRKPDNFFHFHNCDVLYSPIVIKPIQEGK